MTPRSGLRKSLYIFILVVFLSPFFVGSNSSSIFKGKVVEVHRGDLLTVSYAGKNLKIRIYGVICPKIQSDLGKKALDFTSELTMEKVVIIRPYGRDRYGRIIGEILLPDGDNISYELVGRGLAIWDREYAEGDVRLEDLEDKAKKAQKGVWGTVEKPREQIIQDGQDAMAEINNLPQNSQAEKPATTQKTEIKPENKKWYARFFSTIKRWLALWKENSFQSFTQWIKKLYVRAKERFKELSKKKDKETSFLYSSPLA